MGSKTSVIASQEGGEIASLVRSHAWEKTPLGPPETWPQSLRTVVDIVLTSRYAMWMGWGEELTFLYNDAYRPTLGIKHPWALGRPAAQVWSEIWAELIPRVQSVLETGQATFDEGLLLFLERSGFPEETYHTFSYSPLSGDDGAVSGMLCVVTEETDRVIGERRMTTLRDLAARMAPASTEKEVCDAFQAELSQNAKDLPFTLTYLYSDNADARLVCSTNMPDGHPAAPSIIDRASNQPWPAAETFQRPAPRLIQLEPDSMPEGAWSKSPALAALVPIRQQGTDRLAGFFVVGVNPFRRYDEAYSGFVDLVAGQLAAALSNARSYQEERRRADALAELDRAKIAFFSNVSHEFRTPLTLMLGPLEDLLANQEGKGGAQNRDALELIHRSGMRLQRLVNTLLDFARIEAGRTEATYQETELAVFTAELASNFRSAMERAGLQFTVDCQPLSQPVFVDCEMWEKIVLNLLSNAFKYTLSGAVTVRLRERGGRAELTVEDTGVGIPAEEVSRVFERFHRVDQTRGRTHEGTGIGLALVQELVRLHHGTVSVESELGRGSTFTVSLPFGADHLPQVRIGKETRPASITTQRISQVEEALGWLPADSTQAKQTEATGLRSRPSRGQVLLADDNSDMREYVRRLLSEEYEVICAANGEEALSAAQAHPPDLVLSDVMMPVLDGFGLLQALRKNPATRSTPVILLSARAGEEAKVEGLQSGADDYLVKPFIARELMARVAAHLALRQERLRSQERLTQIFLQAPVGIIVLRGPDLVVELANPIYQALLQGRDLIGRPFAEVMPELGEHVWDAFYSVLNTGKPFIMDDFYVPFDQDGDGILEDHWFNVVYHPMQEANDSVSGIIAVVAEVTAQVLARKELERANRELEEFAYAASHDLQEPLRMVSIYSQLLLEEVSAGNKDAETYAGFVRDGVRQMDTLIKDLLTYSRIVHPEQDATQSADLNESLKEALNVLRVRIQESDASIVYGQLPRVIGESRQLSLVFQNLLSNAIKYRQDGSKPVIEIEATELEDRWLISVQDQGIGFNQKHAERIFGLFKRLHKTTYPGTGLGLAICKRIVERYGGQIWAASAGESTGAVFSFTLRKTG